MNIVTTFLNASGKPISGTIVAEGSNGIVEAQVVNGLVDGSLELGEYAVAVSAGGRIVFGPHQMRMGEDGRLVVIREETA